MILFGVADEIVITMLLRREYRNAYDAWVSDGKPHGIFWIPEEAKLGGWYITYASGHAARLASWRWLFHAPKWTAKIHDARPLLILHRVFLVSSLACGIAPFVIVFIVQSAS